MSNDIVRLVDVVEKPDDFYWVIEYFSHKDGICHYSCVGMWIDIKDELSSRTYNCLVENWNMNHVSKCV